MAGGPNLFVNAVLVWDRLIALIRRKDLLRPQKAAAGVDPPGEARNPGGGAHPEGTRHRAGGPLTTADALRRKQSLPRSLPQVATLHGSGNCGQGGTDRCSCTGARTTALWCEDRDLLVVRLGSSTQTTAGRPASRGRDPVRRRNLQQGDRDHLPPVEWEPPPSAGSTCNPLRSVSRPGSAAVLPS